MLNRERLGQIVREVWVECAKTLDDPKPSNLLSWDELDEWNKEVDRKIGERVVAYAQDKQYCTLVRAIAFSVGNKATCTVNGQTFVVQERGEHGERCHVWRFEEDTCYESDLRFLSELRSYYDLPLNDEIWLSV